MKKQIITTIIFLVFFIAVNAQGAINGITVSQGEGEDLRLVDISFNLTGDDEAYDITLAVSFDGVNYVDINNANVTGGLIVAPGNDIHLVWDGRVIYSAQSAQLARIKITATTHVLDIGDYYQSGVIFYIFQNGEQGYVEGETHGLICAVSDQSSGTEWGCYGTEITEADGTAIGTGAQNTIDIEAGCTEPSTAADICANLLLNGYDDWFLPSIDELNEMYQHKATIDATATANGGAAFVSAYSYYWSSSENNNGYAWDQYYYNGNQYSHRKISTFRVRAVRAF